VAANYSSAVTHVVLWPLGWSRQQLAGGALQLDITGAAGHPHTVQLSAGEVRDIAEGKRVSESSSTDSGHSHTVTFN
jgi:hypothetical protein